MSLMTIFLLAAAGTSAVTNGTATITAAHAIYDNAEGYAYFSGNVAVEDAEYKLHADRAYVFLDGTNQFKRVAALGHVAMTNGTRSAHSDRATYHRSSGLVVLTATGETPAEVRDVGKDGDQVVRGRKIKFWTGTRQVEVEEAWISAPTSGMSGDKVKGLLGR